MRESCNSGFAWSWYRCCGTLWFDFVCATVIGVVHRERVMVYLVAVC